MERLPQRDVRLQNKEIHFDPLETKRIEKALAEHKEERPTIDQFADIRTEIDREKDQARLDEVKKKFDHSSPEIERLSEAVEVVFMEFASSWMPGYASRTSEFDDVFNRSDLVLEMENENNQVLRISVDVTYSKQKVEVKIQKIVQELRKGLLSKLKYFESELDGSRDIKTLPQVVLGSDNPAAISSLIRLYLSYQNAKDATKRNLYRKAIEEHSFGQEAFSEIEFQLKRTAEILKSANGKSEDIQKKITVVQATLAEFGKFKEKKMALAKSDDDAQSHNGVLDAIFSSPELTA